MRYIRSGNFLKEAREKAGLTQLEVAKKMGFKSAQFVSNVERGISHYPADKLRLFFKTCKVSRTDQWTFIGRIMHEENYNDFLSKQEQYQKKAEF